MTLCDCKSRDDCLFSIVRQTGGRPFELCKTSEKHRKIFAQQGLAEPSHKMRGVGDVIAKATSSVGIKPCGGCKNRQSWTNAVFPFEHTPVSPLPFTGDVKRNLLFHIYPVKGSNWRDQVDELVGRRHIFNGKVLVGIVTDDSTDSPDEVVSRFSGMITSYRVNPNVRKHGEGVSFSWMLEAVQSMDPNEISFYCHAKGVTDGYGKASRENVHQWTNTMREICLDQMDVVESEIQRKGCVGAFRRLQRMGHAKWYYSGSFFWFRHWWVFQRNWGYIPKKFTGVESWPGMMFDKDEASVIGVDDVGSLYSVREWNKKVVPNIAKHEPVEHKSEYDITLITPTGDRQIAFSLCEKWMSRQTFEGRVQWIVVDDGHEPTFPSMGQEVVRLKPGRHHTLGRNLRAALTRVKSPKVLIIEDDEWYGKEYVKTMSMMLDRHDLVGSQSTQYYWPAVSKRKHFLTEDHSSLCRTGFRSNVISTVVKAAVKERRSVDLALWDMWDGSTYKARLEPMVVGMKGMPGRPCGSRLPQGEPYPIELAVGQDAPLYNLAFPKEAHGDVIAYTSLHGGYDTLHPPHEFSSKLYCVTDQTSVDEPYRAVTWSSDDPPQVRAKRDKILCPFSESEWTVYSDANQQWNIDPAKLVQACIDWEEADLYVIQHNERNSVQAEAEELVKMRWSTREDVDRLLKMFGHAPGLFLGGMLIRRTGRCDAFNQLWWDVVTEQKVRRDQLVLPWVIENSNVRACVLPSQVKTMYWTEHRHNLKRDHSFG